MTPAQSSKHLAKRQSHAPEPSETPHVWEFKARFHRNAFGWKLEPAITRCFAPAESHQGHSCVNDKNTTPLPT